MHGKQRTKKRVMDRVSPATAQPDHLSGPVRTPVASTPVANGSCLLLGPFMTSPQSTVRKTKDGP